MDTIPRNAAFLLETCGCETAVLKGITREFPAFLVSEQGDSVPMRLYKYFRLGQEQALIGPGRYLVAGQTYHLSIPHLQNQDQLNWPEGLSWKTSPLISESRVGFYASPKIDTKMKAEVDQAIVAMVGLRFMPLDSLEFYWVQITATDTWTGDEIQWIQGLAPKQRGMMVGYPLRECGPAPILAYGTEFEIVLTLLGVDGDEGRTSDPVKIGP